MITPFHLKTFKQREFVRHVSNGSSSIHSFLSPKEPKERIHIQEAFNTNPLRLVVPNHKTKVGQNVTFRNMVGMESLDGLSYKISRVLSPNEIEVNFDASSIQNFTSGEIEYTSNLFTENSYEDLKRDILFYKKIQSSNISLVIDENPWPSHVDQFDLFRDTYDIFSCNIDVCSPEPIKTYSYVNTLEGNVYLCVKKGGGDSTVMPNHVTRTAQEYSDGYVWFYMYSYPLNSNFLSLGKIPVPYEELAVDRAYIDEGSIYSLTVTHKGSNLADGIFEYDVVGDGQGGRIELTILNGEVDSYRIVNMGDNYTYAQFLYPDSTVDYPSIQVNVMRNETFIRMAEYVFNSIEAMLTFEFDRNEGAALPVNYRYSTYGLIANVDDQANTTLGYIEVEHTGITTSFVQDDLLYNGDELVGRFVQDSGDGKFLMIPYKNVSPNTSLRNGNKVATTTTDITLVVNNKAARIIAMASHQNPVTRSGSQKETYRMLLKI